MTRRTAPLTTCLVLAGVVLFGRPASGDIINLSPAVGGNAAYGDVFDLIASFAANGAEATGLPVLNSSQLGSVFTPFEADILAADGTCAVVGCNYPLDDPFSAQHYLSLVNAFAPSTPTGRDGLFTLQFPVVRSIPFVIVPTPALATTGTGRVNADVSAPPPSPAQAELSSLLLLGIGLIFAASMSRRLLR